MSICSDHRRFLWPFIERIEHVYSLSPNTDSAFVVHYPRGWLWFVARLAREPSAPDRARSHAATFTVNTADDHNDGVCNAADCSLREAISAANTGDTISFNIPGSGVRTINATSGF